AAHGGPPFEPHATVVGAVAAAAAADVAPYTATTPYMPHVSLLYGDLTDEEK
uniref:Cyclic phosphodiesterase (Fragments) n=1 Tax=Triticum aestivum TaxID=4565 RepID=CPD_WHEAT|nr:RecName: Full=Cyclic phosphodiesterase; Short=CPDase [Triticum aestivum]